MSELAPARQSAFGIETQAEDEDTGAAPSRLRRGLMLISGIFVILFLLAALVPIGAAVIGHGQVGAESRVKRVAHPTGGVVGEVLVRNGQHVQAGQVLVRLQDQVSGADALYSNITVEQLLGQQGRLEAERLDADKIVFSPLLLQAGTASAAKVMLEEQQLLALRRSEQRRLRAQLVARVAQLNQQIAGYSAQISALRRQRNLIEPERRSVRDLAEKQLVTISQVNQLERAAADLEGSIASLEAQIASTRAKISETQEQAVQLVESRRAQAGEQLDQITTTLAQQQSRRVSASDLQFRRDIRAPASGTVDKLALAAAGDVIRAAEPIMEIVPDADAQVVEVLVAPGDVDQVHVGQTALVRFSSFNMASTPEIPSQVTYVAADRSENPETHQPYYLVRVALDRRTLASEHLQLRSGMPAEVHISTGSRSLLSYIIKPLRDQFARAFRDN